MKHILISGERGAGKSTLIAGLVRELNIPVYGYVTKRLSEDINGFHPIYMHRASDYYKAAAKYKSDEAAGPRGCRLSGLDYSEDNLIAYCDGKKHDPHLEVFNVMGKDFIEECFYAQKSSKGDFKGVIIMDELGFLEGEAAEFKKAVFNALDGDIPVIAAVKKYPEAEFTSTVKAHDNARVYELTKENRDELYNLLSEEVNRLF